MKFTVIGCGRWGSFLAWYLSKIGHDVMLYGRPESKKMKNLKLDYKNEYVVLQKSVKLSTNIQESLNYSSYCCVAIQGQNLNEFLQSFSKKSLENKNFILCMKGLDIATNETFSQIAQKYINKNNIAIWAGPGQPQDLTKGTKNCMLIDSYNNALSKDLIKNLQSDLIKFELGNDMIGNEMASAFKNIIGIAGGILDELNMSTLKGPLMVYGAKEIAELIKICGGNPQSAYGLCCLGDFEASLFSPYSNSVKLGRSLITKENFDLYAPGFYTAKTIKYFVDKYKLNLPICSAVYNIIYKNESPKEELEKVLKILDK